MPTYNRGAMATLIGLKNSNFEQKRNIPVLSKNSLREEITTEGIMEGFEIVDKELFGDEFVASIKESKFYLSEN